MINIYLTFNGICEDAFEFYKSVFGGDFSHLGRFSEMPNQDDMPSIEENDKNKVMHVSYPIGEAVLMGSDTVSGFVSVEFGNNFSISVNAKSRSDADQKF